MTLKEYYKEILREAIQVLPTEMSNPPLTTGAEYTNTGLDKSKTKEINKRNINATGIVTQKDNNTQDNNNNNNKV